MFHAIARLAESIRGLLPVGTHVTWDHPTMVAHKCHGTIIGRSLTAYEMATGEFVSFVRVHGKPAPAMPLVVFA